MGIASAPPRIFPRQKPRGRRTRVLEFYLGEKVEIKRLNGEWCPATIMQQHTKNAEFYNVSTSGGWLMPIHRRRIRIIPENHVSIPGCSLPLDVVGRIFQYSSYAEEFDDKDSKLFDTELQQIATANRNGFAKAPKCMYWDDNFNLSDSKRGCW